MHILMLHLEGLPSPFGLRFNSQPRAVMFLEEIRNASAGSTIDIEDDFGQQISIPRSKLLVPQLFDVERDLQAKQELQLLEQRAMQELQRKLNADPRLGLLMPQQGQNFHQ